MVYKRDVINCLKEMKIISRSDKEIIVKARYGPSKETKIPLILDEKLSCLTAAIIGDGHLKKSKFQISFDGFDKDLLEKIKNITQDIFNIKFNITNWKENKKDRYCLRINNKAIYDLLNKIFEIPRGKKSNIVKIPELIKNSNKSIKSAFIIGIMVTEGGRRKRGFGLSTSSNKLWEDLIKMFNEIDIEVKIDRWIYKKYNKEYYGISFKKEKINTILNNCKDAKIKKILLDCKNFKEEYIS